MKELPVPANEDERLAALWSYEILDTLPEQQFDDLTKLVSLICQVPIALISLIDKDRQWFKACIGLSVSGTERDVSFCQYAIMNTEIYEVEDTSQSEIFSGNPLVMHDPYIRFYAGAPLINSQGLSLGTLCVIDRKPRKLTDDQREALYILAREVVSQIELRKQQKELIEAKRMAEEAKITQKQFLANMSHEIRTPLNAIIGISYLLWQENPRIDQVENLKTLKFSAENLMVLINDILDFSKIESGKVEFEEIDFSIKELVNSIKQAQDVRAKEKNIKLKVRFDTELPEVVVGDSVRLAQVLNNLVSNAIKFTFKGGVTIDVMLNSEDEHFVTMDFAVVDTGIGIAKDKLEDIFEDFMQANTDTTRKFGGTGLGLAITRRLLELQDSQIEVESTHGKGSRFYFTLKFKKSAKRQADVAGGQTAIVFEDLAERHIRLLLVEDNEVNQFVVTQFLNKWSIYPDYATNGRVALEKVLNKRYDIILMDLQMPEMDGYEATRRIREMEGDQYKKVPIIALTASALLDVKDRVFTMGMTDYVTKPFNPSDLYRKITKYLSVEAKLPPGEMWINYDNISDLSMGNQQFETQLIQLYIKSLNQLKEQYGQILKERNEEKYRFLEHKMRPIVTLLEVKTLEEEITRGEELICSTGVDEQLLTASAEKVRNICDQVIEQLQKRMEV